MADRMIQFQTSDGDVSVTSTQTDITWDFNGASNAELWAWKKRIQTYVFRLEVATTALNTLKAWGKVHTWDDTWVLLAGNAATDYTLGNSEFVKFAQVYSSAGAIVDKDLASIAATQTGVLVLANPGFAEIKLTATTASGTATVSGYVSGYEADVNMGAQVNVEANIGNVGILDAAEAEIDPSTAYAEDTAYTATDYVTPLGLVRKDTRAAVGSAANADYTAAQGTATGELRTRDDDAVTALQLIDDWDESDRAKVNPIVGQAGVAAGAGAVGVTVPRTTLASDDPAVAALEIIDDWDETDRAAVNLIAGQVGIAAGSGAVSALTPRVILATDDPAVASLAIIDDWDETNRAAVNIIAGQVGVSGDAGATDALTQRVILATDDPAVASVANIETSNTEAAFTYAEQFVAVPGTAEALVASETFAILVQIRAAKAAGANAGNVYVGDSAVDKTSAQMNTLAPGDFYEIAAPAGRKFDLNDIYVDSINAADGVLVTYLAA